MTDKTGRTRNDRQDGVTYNDKQGGVTRFCVLQRNAVGADSVRRPAVESQPLKKTK
ncbi:hypothetical protein FACS1894211_01640 [Clostridia bacterium]|nr:hypothetical protein FACS1894211_01640 [Clostridia bacterium]